MASVGVFEYVRLAWQEGIETLAKGSEVTPAVISTVSQQVALATEMLEGWRVEDEDAKRRRATLHAMAQVTHHWIGMQDRVGLLLLEEWLLRLPPTLWQRQDALAKGFAPSWSFSTSAIPTQLPRTWTTVMVRMKTRLRPVMLDP